MAKRMKRIFICIIVLLGITLSVFVSGPKNQSQEILEPIEVGGIMTDLHDACATVVEVDYDTGILLAELEKDYEKIAYLEEKGLSDLNDKFFAKKEVVLECSKNKISESHVKDGDKISFSLFLFDITDEEAPVPIQEIRVCPKEGIESAAAGFFEGKYEYRKEDTYFHGETKLSSTVTEGTVIYWPYLEHIKIVSSSEPTLWDEMYLNGYGQAYKKVVDAKIHIGDEWQDTKMNREYPYGYGEDLEFKFDREEEADERKIEVYTTEYTVDVSENFRLEEELKATVTQEYFLEKDSNTLIKISTDLTDLNEKLFIANDISVNGAALDTAQKKAEEETGLSEIVTLEIFNYDGDISIEIP